MNEKQQKMILFVDDEELHTVYGKISLENYGYIVIVTNTGEKAIDIINKTPSIDLILMDIDLGSGIDGSTAAEIILKDKDIPIIFFSSNTEPEVIEKTERITSYGYILKGASDIVLNASIKMAFKLFEANKKIKERVRELNGIYSIGLLAENIENTEDFYNELVNSLIPLSMQFPEKVFISLEIENKIYSNLKNTNLEESKNYISAPIPIFGKQSGKLLVAYSDDLPYINIFEQKLIHAYAERISKIEEIRQTKALLIAREERYRILLDSINDAVFIYQLNADGTPDNFIEVNDLACKRLGYSKNELLKLSPKNIGRSSNNQSFNMTMDDFYTNKRMLIEWIHLTSTGKEIPVEVSSHLFELHGNQTVISVARDITDRKEADKKLKIYMQELENLDQTKNKFFNIIAHDLRNPFTGILGIIELIESKMIEEPMDESLKDYHHYILMLQSSAQSAYTLLENLLQWARSQTGEISVNPVNASLNPLLSHIIQLVSGNAFNKNITIEEKLMDNDIVFADESMVDTILRNLLTNAIKFTHRNGKIVLSTKTQKDFLEISITDTGVGIAPTNLEKIFKINSKFSTLGTDKEKGTGLGLILCKEFVEKQGGTIWVTSQVEIGSTFTFTLPRGK